MPISPQKAEQTLAAAQQATLAKAKLLQDPVLWGVATWHIKGDPEKPYRMRGWEFLREPLATRAPFMAIQKAAQIGMTEGMILRGMAEADWGKTVIYAFEVDFKATAMVKERVNTNLALDAYLRSRCKDADSVQQKQVGKGWIYFQGAQNLTKVTSTAADTVIKDERDLMPNDSAEYFNKRVKASSDPCVIEISNPTFPEVGINAAYLAGDMREWFTRCPHCSQLIPLRWIKENITEGGQMLCPQGKCRRPIDRLAPGQWIPGITLVKKHPSWHINGLQAPNTDPAKVVLLSQSPNSTVKQAAIRMDMGEPYLDKSSGLDFADIKGAAGSWASKPHAPGGFMVVDPGGVFDVQIYEKDKGDGVLRCVYSGFVSGFGELESLTRASGVTGGIMDYAPELDGARNWCKAHQGWRRSVYDIEKVDGPLYHPDSTQGDLLHVNRTRLADDMVTAIRSRAMLLPQEDAFSELSRLAMHLRAPKRLIERDDRGNYKVRWFHEPSQPDHQFHCCMYAILFKASGGMVARAARNVREAEDY